MYGCKNDKGKAAHGVNEKLNVLHLAGAIVLALLVIAFCVACGGNDAQHEFNLSAHNKNEAIDASKTEQSLEATLGIPNTEVPTEMGDQSRAEGTVTNIEFATDFSEGIAFVRYEDSDGNKRDVAIDTTGKILFELDDNLDINHINGYEDGILVEGNIVYDKTGKVIASPKISGYDELISENCNGYLIARKVEESFEGDKYFIGVLNNRGEWEQPLSDDNPIVKAFENAEDVGGLYFSREYDHVSYMVLGFDVTFADRLYYHIATNEVTAGYTHYEFRNYQGEDPGIYQYDLYGNCSLILGNYSADAFFDDCFLGKQFKYDEEGNYTESGYMLYDYEGNVIVDMSRYKIMPGSFLNVPNDYYVNDHMLVSVDNGTGGRYLCLIGKTGEPAFEPIRMGSSDHYSSLDEYGFTYTVVDGNGGEDKLFFYDYSGNATEIEYTNFFSGFEDGLAHVMDKQWENYYINTKGERVIG